MESHIYLQSIVLEVYEYFNIELFENQLPDVIVNFSRESKRSYGYFSPDRWESGDKKYHEINLNPNFFRRSVKETYGTLVHEMVHLWQNEFGKNNPRRCYHNKEWASKMKEVGLYPSNTGQAGGKETGQNCSHYILDDAAYDQAFENMPKELMIKILNVEVSDVQKPVKSKNKVVYICPLLECGQKVWAKPEMKIACFHTRDSEKFMIMEPQH